MLGEERTTPSRMSMSPAQPTPTARSARPRLSASSTSA